MEWYKQIPRITKKFRTENLKCKNCGFKEPYKNWYHMRFRFSMLNKKLQDRDIAICPNCFQQQNYLREFIRKTDGNLRQFLIISAKHPDLFTKIIIQDKFKTKGIIV